MHVVTQHRHRHCHDESIQERFLERDIPRKDVCFLHILEHWHLSLYLDMHVHLWNMKPNLRNFIRLLYCPDGSYLALPHTVTSTILSMHCTSGTSMVPCTFLNHRHLSLHHNRDLHSVLVKELNVAYGLLQGDLSERFHGENLRCRVTRCSRGCN